MTFYSKQSKISLSYKVKSDSTDLESSYWNDAGNHRLEGVALSYYPVLHIGEESKE